MLTVKHSPSMGRHRYFTFMPEEATVYVREHLEERVTSGEMSLRNHHYLALAQWRIRTNSFLRTKLVASEIRYAFSALTQ
ncbi:MAG: hypothetical protein KIY12_07900 [Thermoplasmata archaeon]|uniref:Uncharacterized protein n=1 Tax=Candidatus Sysuiplasma superficiale TaxID=2823368 RepID=A0A8J8CFE3_9ARCH|nr:hypothetical protein [Candidatus Sysuiplasma superficiale]MBX8644625.1 hypothetical protein [Candidatus Sysuiplasma superficiale]